LFDHGFFVSYRLMSVITALEAQKRNKDRVNVYLDDEYAFSLDIMAAAQLTKGQHLTDAEIAMLQAQGEVSKAVERAVRFLSYRPRSIAEVRRNLAEKQTPAAVIDAAVERLNSLGYLDDRAFAAFWVENRSTFKPLSQRALRYELRQKGVARADIDAALAHLDEEETALQAARTQIRRLRRRTQDQFRAKMSAFLQRRGFGYSVIESVTETVIAEIENEDPDYFEITNEE
jgi:regulatory protein